MTSVYDAEDTEETRQENEPKRRVNRLTEIRPPIVSVVQRGANRGRYILKSSEEKTMNTAVEDEFGNQVTEETVETVDQEKEQNQTPEPASESAQDEVTEKVEMIPSPVKAKALEVLNAASERVKALLEKINGLQTTEEKVAKPIPVAIEQETKAIAALLNGLLDKYPTPQSQTSGKENDDEENMDQEKDTKKSAASLSKKQLRALRKMLANMGSLLKELDPDAKKAMQEFGVVLKEDTSKNDQIEALTKELADLKQTITDQNKALKKQAEKISKMERAVPDGLSDSFVNNDRKKQETKKSDFVFGWIPGK